MNLLVPTQKPRIVSYCDEETHEILKAIAVEEDRSLSKLVDMLLAELAQLKPVLDAYRSDAAWKGLPYAQKIKILIEETTKK
ncbi:MAG: hypothetical protein SFY66_10785 [Oculatellaceae cyanobacterium bins.114]|nr:hypothetical protein [Oculatellaceae cyanobacterium bins.114]